MEPKLKVKEEAKDWAEALGIDKEQVGKKIVTACESAFSTHEVLAKLWEGAETPEEVMVMAFLVGLTEGLIRAEEAVKYAKDETITRFMEVNG